jgi:hypothetical protein
MQRTHFGKTIENSTHRQAGRIPEPPQIFNGKIASIQSKYSLFLQYILV